MKLLNKLFVKTFLIGIFASQDFSAQESKEPTKSSIVQTALSNIEESVVDKIKSYFFGKPAINGIEVLKTPSDQHLLNMLSGYGLGSIEKSIIFDFGLTHATEESLATDSYKNLVLPWKRIDCKTEFEKNIGSQIIKDSQESYKEIGKPALPAKIIVQFGPENPSSIGNFLFTFLFNFDMNKENQESYSKLDSIGFNTTARGFFGDQSGWLKNIELIFQLGCTYDMLDGCSKYEFHKYDEFIDKDKTALAGTINEYYFAFEGMMGLFYQHPSNRFRTGLFWTNNNYFNTSKSSTILSNASKPDEIKDYSAEFSQKVKALTLQTKKVPKIYSEFGGLVEMNFFTSALSLGCSIERLYISEPDIKNSLNLKTQCLSINPYTKFAFTSSVWSDNSLLIYGKVELKNFLNISKNDQYKLLARALNFSLQLNF